MDGHTKFPQPPAPPQVAPPVRQNRPIEADLVATWAARMGAIATFIGIAYGYKYAVDRGIIGPTGRVLTGVAFAVAFLLGAEWTERLSWSRLTQALDGGGVGILYLSVWVAFDRYALITAPAALAGLFATSMLACALALRRDSMVLAIVGTIGAFMAPFFEEFGRTSSWGLFTYLLVVDAAVLFIGFYRDWRALARLAFIGTWVSFGAAQFIGADIPTRVAFATAYFLLFSIVSVVHAKAEGIAGFDEIMFVGSGVAYGAAGYFLLSVGYHTYQSPFIAALSLAYCASAYAAHRYVKDADRIIGVTLSMAAVLITLWVPIALHAPWMPAGWAVEALVLVGAGRFISIRHAARAGMVVATFSLVPVAIWYLSGLLAYSPPHLLLNAQSVALGVHAFVFFMTALILVRSHDREERENGAALAVTANVITLLWLGLETHAYVDRILSGPSAWQAFQFSLSVTWIVYAGIVVTIGVLIRSRVARYFAMAVMGVAIAKMVVTDVWLVDVGLRTIAFISLGAILILSSVLYHRYREAITESHPRHDL